MFTLPRSCKNNINLIAFNVKPEQETKEQQNEGNKEGKIENWEDGTENPAAFKKAY